MLRIPQYGKKDRQVNHIQEIRDAILYKKEDVLRTYSNSHPNEFAMVIRMGSMVDPSYVAQVCPNLLPEIVDHLVSLTDENADPVHQQVPEVILRIARMEGADRARLWNVYVASCKQFSLDAILEAMDIYPIDAIEDFVIQNNISEGNCKGLLDLTLYHKAIDQVKYANLFIQHRDIYGAIDMVTRGLIDVQHLDDGFYNRFAAELKDTDSSEFERAFEELLAFTQQLPDKVNLDRIETDLIAKDQDHLMAQFAVLFPGRDAIPNYLMVKKILNS